MARTKKEVVEQVTEELVVSTEPVYLSFAEVMKINRELKAQGLIPADPELPPRKRSKTKRF